MDRDYCDGGTLRGRAIGWMRFFEEAYLEGKASSNGLLDRAASVRADRLMGTAYENSLRWERWNDPDLRVFPEEILPGMDTYDPFWKKLAHYPPQKQRIYYGAYVLCRQERDYLSLELARRIVPL